MTVQLGRATLKVDARAYQAFVALDQVFDRHSYDVHPAYPEGDTGAYNCRHMRHDPKLPMSSHSWATAVDVNWQTNPDGSRLVTDMPDELIADVHRLITTGGAPVWRWGGDWDRDPSTGHSYYDAMHFELICTPGELAAGIRTGGRGMIEPILYAKRGTTDRLLADWASDAGQRGCATSNMEGVLQAARDGADVIAVGGPADRDLDGVPHRTAVGDDAWDTGRVLIGMLD